MEDDFMVMMLQLMGLGFGLVMLFIAYYYYVKNAYTYRSLIGWIGVWIAFIVFALFPDMLVPLTQVLRVERVIDLFVIGTLFVLTALVFALYVITKRTEKRVEELVSKLAREKK